MSTQLSKVIGQALFQCNIDTPGVEVRGPLSLCLQAKADGEVRYANLKTETLSERVEVYHEMLDFAAIGAMLGRHIYGTSYRSPALISARFYQLLALNQLDLLEIARLNAAETGAGVCHTHDFCDANVAMLEAVQSLVGEFFTYDGTTSAADRKLWASAWEHFVRRLQLQLYLAKPVK